MDKNTADLIIHTAATLALLYYPEAAADDPHYDLTADVAYVLTPLAGGHTHPRLRELTAQVIIDPTGTRDAFTAAVYELVDD